MAKAKGNAGLIIAVAGAGIVGAGALAYFATQGGRGGAGGLALPKPGASLPQLKAQEAEIQGKLTQLRAKLAELRQTVHSDAVAEMHRQDCKVVLGFEFCSDGPTRERKTQEIYAAKWQQVGAPLEAAEKQLMAALAEVQSRIRALGGV